MLESSVDDTAEDLSKVAVDAHSWVIIVIKCVLTFVDWGGQTLVPNIGEDARAEDNLEEFKNSQL